ncbi:carbamoyltransferase HypF [Sphaerisporangium sp. B11E5]|uniref:carbamoyltransferase HypF n=1 Tax=Sphaerisporangium sp. B11E5 TaxID=3153563 RepID=UPI00325DC69F
MDIHECAPAERLRIRVTGVVQGVGYRPFVCKLALAHQLAGWVLNDPEGVLTEVEGPPEVVERFTRELRTLAPPQARVDTVRVVGWPEPRSAAGEGFAVHESLRTGRRATIVPPDMFVCADCLAELRDPGDRRYRYPFITCANCGPRYSIVQGLPYDRARTTMSAFRMCGPCAAEYRDPLDRRHHAQPNACPACGPRLLAAGPGGDTAEGESALAQAAATLAAGGVVAVKGVGGFHVAVDARNAAAVARLRARKRRGAEPFAVMARDLATVALFAEPTEAEQELLTSPARPVVLVRRRAAGTLPEAVAPRNPGLGVMLPSAPHHHLLADTPGLDILVMTSGDIAGGPIVHRDEDALDHLFRIADLILYHDRDIQIPVDDSVVRHTEHPGLAGPLLTFLRRSRGYAPYSVEVGVELEQLVAYGAELKATVALTHGTRVYLSQHIGDLRNDETFAAHRRTVEHLTSLYEAAPRHAAVDLHPRSRGTRIAVKEHGGEDHVLRVRHHHAHMASCMAENRLDGSVLGVVFDGSGYGEDGTAWGGEFLLGGYLEARRVARLRHLPLVGGDRAVTEPVRTGFALALDALGGPEEAVEAFPALRRLGERERHVFATMARRGVNAPPASSMGRLFDAVAALLDVCVLAEYEAQGPIELEGLLARDLTMSEEPYRFATYGEDGLTVMDPRPVTRALAADLAAGVPLPVMSRRFHTGVVRAVVERCVAARVAEGPAAAGRAVLSGSVFANEFLLVNCLIELRAKEFSAYCHRQVPCDDGGIALGQAMIADARLKAAREEETAAPARGSATAGVGASASGRTVPGGDGIGGAARAAGARPVPAGEGEA